MSKHTYFTVSKTASVTVDPNYFTMSLNISAEDDTVSEAKEKLESLVNDFNSKFAELFELFDKNSVKKSYSVQDYSNYRKDIKSQAVFYLSFGCNDISKAKEMYDSFVKFRKINVNTPKFEVKNVTNLEKDLLKLAKEKCEDQAKMECEIIGVNFYNVKPISWKNYFSHEEDYDADASRFEIASARSLSAKSSKNTDPLNFEPGKTKVSVSLEISYGE